MRAATDAHAAPAKFMSNAKIKIGSRIAFTTPPKIVTYMDEDAAPWDRKTALATILATKIGRLGMIMRRYEAANSAVSPEAPINVTWVSTLNQTAAANMAPSTTP